MEIRPNSKVDEEQYSSKVEGRSEWPERAWTYIGQYSAGVHVEWITTLKPNICE